MAKRRTLVQEVRDVASSWRWGRRPMMPRSAIGVSPPPERWQFPTDWSRTPAAAAARDVILTGVLKPLIWAQATAEVFGLEHLDVLPGPVMFISNHSSHLDATLILATLPPRWRYRTATAAAKDYFFDVWWRRAFTTLVYAAFPIERGAGERATLKAKEVLEQGWSLIVFPEGTRTQDGWVQRFRHGTARLAIEERLPIVPVAIIGAYHAMPKGSFWGKAGKPIRIRYGPPLFPQEGERHQDLSLRMQQAIAELFDEDRTSWWQATSRAARDETPKLSGPAGPHWLRVWEGLRPVRRPGRPPTWR